MLYTRVGIYEKKKKRSLFELFSFKGKLLGLFGLLVKGV